MHVLERDFAKTCSQLRTVYSTCSRSLATTSTVAISISYSQYKKFLYTMGQKQFVFAVELPFALAINRSLV